ncbi:hypothetical protein [Aquabacter sediminis]|uniref:hypothetical protein n=1 Tax=Aquabacter sediminis TaxID=3029197 RepID=UPI00237E711A|nr:hypothetical protein [Aquabacter sp. P-9]MDE1568799.1 hypothetical protein [Aquabacter sp. P-9]
MLNRENFLFRNIRRNILNSDRKSVLITYPVTQFNDYEAKNTQDSKMKENEHQAKEFILALQEIQKKYLPNGRGPRKHNRSLIAKTARLVKKVESNKVAVRKLMRHPFWQGATVPVNFMHAAMAFVAGSESDKGFRQALKRAQAVEFLINQGWELQDLERGLEEGINKICARSGKGPRKSGPKQHTSTKNGRERGRSVNSAVADCSATKPKDKGALKPVIFTGKAAKNLRRYQDGQCLKVIMKLQDATTRTIEIIELSPLKE